MPVRVRPSAPYTETAWRSVYPSRFFWSVLDHDRPDPYTPAIIEAARCVVFLLRVAVTGQVSVGDPSGYPALVRDYLQQKAPQAGSSGVVMVRAV